MRITEYDARSHAEHGLMVGFPPAPEKRVTSENGLWVSPYNRWAFQNMRRLLPTAGWRAAGSPHVLPRQIVDFGDLEISRNDGSVADIDTYLTETFTDSMVVVHDGAVVFEAYLNGMTSQQPHQMMSCTKSFIGLFALQAVAEGLQSEDDLMGALLPELAESGFADSRLGDVLNMANSLQFNEDYDDPNADIQNYATIIGFGGVSNPAFVGTTIYDYLATLQRDHDVADGDMFRYQTPKTDAVDWATCRATGTSLLTRFENLWERLGADGDAYLLLDSGGTPVAGGGLNATSEDLARFAAMVLNEGRVGDEVVVSKDILDDLSAGGSREAFSNGPEAVEPMEGGDWSYRAKWWIRHTSGREAISAIGVNGQWMYCDRERGVAIVKQSSQPVAVHPEFDTYTIDAFDKIIAALV